MVFNFSGSMQPVEDKMMLCLQGTVSSLCQKHPSLALDSSTACQSPVDEPCNCCQALHQGFAAPLLLISMGYKRTVQQAAAWSIVHNVCAKLNGCWAQELAECLRLASSSPAKPDKHLQRKLQE